MRAAQVYCTPPLASPVTKKGAGVRGAMCSGRETTENVGSRRFNPVRFASIRPDEIYFVRFISVPVIHHHRMRGWPGRAGEESPKSVRKICSPGIFWKISTGKIFEQFMGNIPTRIPEYRYPGLPGSQPRRFPGQPFPKDFSSQLIQKATIRRFLEAEMPPRCTK